MNSFLTAMKKHNKRPCQKQGLPEADNGNRTRLPSLGSWCSTDELQLQDSIILAQKRKEGNYNI